MSAIVVPNTSGVSTHGNDLAAPVGSTSVADNVSFSRDGRPERRTGFKDYSTNLPDFDPVQLVSGAAGDQAYLHLDNGLWYKDSSSENWLRKRGAVGCPTYSMRAPAYSLSHLYIVSDQVVLDINLATGTRTVLAGRADVAGAHVDATGDAARFNNPTGMVVVGGNLYVADSSNYCIRKIVISTGVVTTFAGSLTNVSGHVDAVGTAARFNSPIGICTDGTDLYVADYTAIRKIVVSSATVSTVAGSTAGVSGYVDAVGTAARFTAAIGICTDGTYIYVAESHDIRKIVISSATVSTVAGLTSTAAFADGVGTNARFSSPQDIDIVGSNLYVSDKYNYCIRKIVISTSTASTPFGLGSTFGDTDGIGAAARFGGPVGTCYDGADLYVVDPGISAIRKIYLSTSYVYTIDGGDDNGVGLGRGAIVADGIVVGPD